VADYCEPRDVYAHGLPRGAVPNPARLAESVSSSTNAITLSEHGFSLNDPASFRAEAGGSLPAPLVEGTTYYAIALDDARFQVANAEDGAPIDLTTAGSNVLVISPLPIASAITWASQIIDDMLPAHVVPLDADAIPEIVRMTCAELAAGKLARYSGAESKPLMEIVDAATKRLERWGKGVPIRGAVEPPNANLARSATAPYRDRRGWNRTGVK
jgi:hypothetical protein